MWCSFSVTGNDQQCGVVGKTFRKMSALDRRGAFLASFTGDRCRLPCI